jgi:hypothetical protein
MSDKKEILNIDQFLKLLKENKKDKSIKIDDNYFLFKQPLPVYTHAHIKNSIGIPNYLYMADTLYLPNSQFGYKYCLVVVDVYDSKCDAVALKEKTQEAVYKGFKKLFKQKILEPPQIMQMDSGSEFKNKLIKDYFDDLKIVVKYTLTNRHKQNSIVERKNREIGNIILTYQGLKEAKTKKISKTWHEYLPKIIKYLNENLKPPKTNTDYWNSDVKCKNSECELLDVGDKVYHILDYPKNALGKKQSGKFRVGDVRFDDKPKTIGHVILSTGNPPLYILNKENSNDLNKSVAYGRNELLLVSDVKKN